MIANAIAGSVSYKHIIYIITSSLHHTFDVVYRAEIVNFGSVLNEKVDHARQALASSISQWSKFLHCTWLELRCTYIQPRLRYAGNQSFKSVYSGIVHCISLILVHSASTHPHSINIGSFL